MFAFDGRIIARLNDFENLIDSIITFYFIELLVLLD